MSRRSMSGAMIGASLLMLMVGLPAGCAEPAPSAAPLPAGLPPGQPMVVAEQEPGAPPRRWPLVVEAEATRSSCISRSSKASRPTS